MHDLCGMITAITKELKAYFVRECSRDIIIVCVQDI